MLSQHNMQAHASILFSVGFVQAWSGYSARGSVPRRKCVAMNVFTRKIRVIIKLKTRESKHEGH